MNLACEVAEELGGGGGGGDTSLPDGEFTEGGDVAGGAGGVLVGDDGAEAVVEGDGDEDGGRREAGDGAGDALVVDNGAGAVPEGNGEEEEGGGEAGEDAGG